MPVDGWICLRLLYDVLRKTSIFLIQGLQVKIELRLLYFRTSLPTTDTGLVGWQLVCAFMLFPVEF